MHKLLRASLNLTKSSKTNTKTKTLTQPLYDHLFFNGRQTHATIDLHGFKVSHPWPEWNDFMDYLLTRGYFSEQNPFRFGDMGHYEVGLVTKACINFSQDRFDLIRFLSRENIKVIGSRACPSLSPKVVEAAKRLRFDHGVDEGDTCSSCNLRGDCEMAYMKACEGEGGCTVDVMQILIAYGLSSIARTVKNERVLDEEVIGSVKILLKEIVECGERALESDHKESEILEKPDSEEEEDQSTSPENSISRKYRYPNVQLQSGDWRCPVCKFANFSKNITCLHCDHLNEDKLQRSNEKLENSPLKKGDWICDKCKFMNFAKNTKCMICKERPKNRDISPGEWVCPSCYYINFTRNRVCLECDCKRPLL